MRPTTNLVGGPAFDRSTRVALASLALTSMLSKTHYESGDDQLDTVRALVRKLAEEGDLKFAAQLAVYTRHTFGMRTVSHVIAGEVAQLRGEFPDQSGEWGTAFFNAVVHRADDMSEIAAYWIATYVKGKKKTLPNAMKRGFARVFARMSGHNLAKYNGASTRSLTLRQLAHLCHPKGPDGKTDGEVLSAVYQLRGGVLASADTHETAMSKAGNAEDVEATTAAEWVRLFKENKIQYLAALRNARRIIEQAPEAVAALCTKLVSLDDIRGSKVFPFQFLAAHNAVSESNGKLARTVLSAIEDGAELALSNMPELPGATLVCLDDSGSMLHNGGPEWHKKPAIVGSMFATALVRRNEDCDLMLFCSDGHYRSLSSKIRLFDGVQKITANLRGAYTNFDAPFETANRKYDRIFILSDGQGWAAQRTPLAALRAYEKRHDAKPFIYSWDLVGNVTSQFPESRIAVVAGYAATVFDVVRQMETDREALIHAIEAVDFK